jgi:hypothetical protein
LYTLGFALFAGYASQNTSLAQVGREGEQLLDEGDVFFFTVREILIHTMRMQLWIPEHTILVVWQQSLSEILACYK